MVARVCGQPGCPELTPCPHHPRTSWSNTSARNLTRPSDFKERKARVLVRDGRRCYWCGQAGADHVDHVVAVADGGSWHDSNLASIHANPCHREKTLAERRERQTRSAHR